MKTLASVGRAALVGVAVLLGAAARLLDFFLVTERDEMKRSERGAGVFGRNDIAPFDSGAGAAENGDFSNAGYTEHGREPIAVGRDGQRVGAYSGAPILHY
ncbi:hypothetical protein [Aromatoleum aromaticum]|uniref:hypothetical protein n=1 Tax=Aromatoleum aromaticum TaxID=551760 RepID=UPI0005A288FE|nr:hypothetical protein [Aromatoleum aromaticum]